MRNTCRTHGSAIDAPTFEIITTPNPTQNRALELIAQIFLKFEKTIPIFDKAQGAQLCQIGVTRLKWPVFGFKLAGLELAWLKVWA
mgnify:CR=1 FL=1